MTDSRTQVDAAKLAAIALAGTHSGLSARLRQIDFAWTTDGVSAEGTFGYLAFRDGQLTQDEFVDFVYIRGSGNLLILVIRPVEHRCHGLIQYAQYIMAVRVKMSQTHMGRQRPSSIIVAH